MTTPKASLPTPPPRARYALTVPQSVLFADLSLRGNTRPIFAKVMTIDYEPEYISIDNGAMVWDYTLEEPFARLLGNDFDGGAEGAVQTFINVVGTTSRSVVRAAQAVGPSANRHARPDAKEMLDDLRYYWSAYEEQMTNLFTFWNIENLLTSALVDHLSIQSGSEWQIEDFVTPNEPNYFALERAHLSSVAQRFSSASDEDTLRAATFHGDLFGFLLAPFNLGSPPTGEEIRTRLAESAVNTSVATQSGGAQLDLSGLSAPARRLVLLTRQLTFWKTERLDALALSDALVADLYKDAMALLGIDSQDFFSLTRREVEDSLAIGSIVVSDSEIAERRSGYCMALNNGDISFYAPSPLQLRDTSFSASAGDVLIGNSASPGRAEGLVRIVGADERPTMHSNEILVTSMTRPEMDINGALTTAAAYVTDEGGIINHAAIVARENRKPCVTGTEDASQRLRDGMLVLVDGDAGTVTVLADAE